MSARDEILAAAGGGRVRSSPATQRRCASCTTRSCAGRPTAATSATATRYIRGNTEGDLVWRDQRLSDIDVVVVGDTAVLTALVHDEFERAGEPGAHTMRLTLTWVREEGAWRVLAGHAGPAA